MILGFLLCKPGDLSHDCCGENIKVEVSILPSSKVEMFVFEVKKSVNTYVNIES